MYTNFAQMWIYQQDAINGCRCHTNTIINVHILYILLQLSVGYDSSPLKRVKILNLTREWRNIVTHMGNWRRMCFSHYLTRTLFQNPLADRFGNMRGKAQDILILKRITDFSTTGSAGSKRRNNGRNHITMININKTTWHPIRYMWYCTKSGQIKQFKSGKIFHVD